MFNFGGKFYIAFLFTILKKPKLHLVLTNTLKAWIMSKSGLGFGHQLQGLLLRMLCFSASDDCTGTRYCCQYSRARVKHVNLPNSLLSPESLSVSGYHMDLIQLLERKLSPESLSVSGHHMDLIELLERKLLLLSYINILAQ